VTLAVGARLGPYEITAALGAGLRVRIGPWVLRANLQDELKFFAEMSDGAS